MTRVMIEAENLTKQYKLGQSHAFAQTLPERVAHLAGAPLRWVTGKTDQPQNCHQTQRSILAVRDVSFTLNEGEVLGIVGPNGAGKSTLLKLLSRITDPTEGWADLYGRVASLLEVGTGFHPELTGRENTFLNGSLLGMSRGEIRKKFDEIVAFSGVEKFLDTPVKRYSSGMRVRLAFAVAAHLDPEILIVDEVLAVGDADFQRKCLAKMNDVARSGRTVLFVSHNLAAVQKLCSRAILLDQGKLMADGTPDEIVQRYLSTRPKQEYVPVAERTDRDGTGGARVLDCQVHAQPEYVSVQDQQVPVIAQKPWQIDIDYRLEKPGQSFALHLKLHNHQRVYVSYLDTDNDATLRSDWPSTGRATLRMDEPCPLLPGLYNLDVNLLIDGFAADWIKDAVTFEVVANPDATFVLPSTQKPMIHMPLRTSLVALNDETSREAA